MSENNNRVALRSPLTCYYAYRAATGAEALPPLVLGLHGWGMNCGGFLRRLEPLAEAGLTVAALQGPHQFYLDMGSKKVGFSWLTAYERDTSIQDLHDLIENTLDDLARRVAYDPERVFVLGFSQGVSIAWRYAVRTRRRLAGIIACCSDLPPDVAAMLPGRTPVPAFLAHAVDDPLIPRDKLEQACAALTAAVWSHDVLEYEGGHELAPAAGRIAAWVLARANRPIQPSQGA